MPLAAGSRLGPYEVVDWIGAGGMGDVYRARDPRLARDVAIKVIPERFAADPDRLRRFEQEARAAGQLNHPNILAVYDIGAHAGAPYIVSELLEGESLRSRLRGGALAAPRAVDFAEQIADGLAAAHDKAIVHRDIKPDNLFITSDGRIKILDFGVAKLTMASEHAAPAEATDTAPEVVVGTAAYMSPEQVRGEVVDARSDIFSLGTVLHEMLTGRGAFARGSAAEVTAAVLKEDPAPPLPAGVPAALQRIVTRCLEKSREARFQSARDLMFSLKSHGRAGASVLGPWITIAAAAVVALGVLAAGYAWFNSEAAPLLDFANAEFTRFTEWEGTEALAEISPDGRFVAFISDKDGEFDLHVSQIGTGEYTNLTQNLPGMNPPGVVLRSFGFSGDGADLWYSQTGQPGDRKQLLRLLSRTTRPFLGPGDAAPAWSPDGSRVVYLNNKEGGGDPLFVADAVGGEARQIYVGRPGEHNHNPTWSPDGEWIYFARGTEPTAQMDIWRIRSTGGQPEQLTKQSAAINFLAAVDAHTVIYVGRAEDQSGPWLWSLDVTTRAVRRVGLGVNPYTSVSASRDGRHIVATVADPTVQLWTVPILGRLAEDRDVRRSPIAAARALAPRVAGDSTYYLSARGTGDGLYRFRGGETTQIFLDAKRPLSEPVAVSRDRQRLAVVMKQDGKRRLVVMSEDGTNPTTLAPDVEILGAAGSGSVDWSPDGEWIAAGGSDARGPALFKIPVKGGAAVRLVDGPAVDPIWSPDGRVIVYAGPFVDGQVPLHGVSQEGARVELPEIRVRQGGYRFLSDSEALVYLERTRSLDFWRLDLKTGARRPLTRLGDFGQLHAFDISANGKEIVFDRLRENSNIALIELPKR
ncbi:MAG TPA: protein kinase [Vicinamibacterales bacterium]|nr:protein kinase [Vicinamibacterales bacterium]